MTARYLPVFLVLISLAGCSNGPARDEAPAAGEPPRIRVAVAETREVERSISVTGSLRPDEAVFVGAEVPGRVADIQVDFGQRVRKGDVIAQLDKRELSLQLERVRAALAQALARIGLKPGEEDVVPESTPSIRQAQAQLEDARTRYESAADLVKTGDIAHDRFVETEKAYRAREAALDAARHELRTMLASIQALRAEVKLAEKRLDDATVRAPFTGAVTERLASPGQFLKANEPIVRLVKSYPLRLRADLPESAAGAVRSGTSLTFVTDAIPGAEFSAVVRELNPSLDARSRSLSVEARITKHDPRLRPGMFVQVKLVVERNAAIVVVPEEALQRVAGLTKVFAIRDGRAVEQKIVPGIRRDGWVEAPGGQIRPGDQVAVSDLATLIDGAAVRIESPASPRS